ncbi:hypothetical protein DFH94DRAFT_682161 [Russula ochroleuca]|uniref:Uncharacterized protein n=1 Tax=Russula ochroleuca TaxID=152965 RepID=A0A9P5T966_9AGAM|nr:hypothetical protein DFH94DRAFT_682161 [Russula ochroleuca]
MDLRDRHSEVAANLLALPSLQLHTDLSWVDIAPLGEWHGSVGNIWYWKEAVAVDTPDLADANANAATQGPGTAVWCTCQMPIDYAMTIVRADMSSSSLTGLRPNLPELRSSLFCLCGVAFSSVKGDKQAPGYYCGQIVKWGYALSFRLGAIHNISYQPKERTGSYSSPLITSHSLWELSSLIGARSYVGLSIGAHSYLFWQTISCTEHVVLSPGSPCFFGYGMGQGTKYRPKQTIHEDVISGYDSYRVRKRRKKLAQFFPMWSREVKIIRTNRESARQHGLWPSSPELHITAQHGARVMRSLACHQLARIPPLGAAKASALGNSFFKPKTQERGRKLSPFFPLHTYMGGANADLGTTLLFAQAPVRESDFPFLPCRLTRARTHAHIHARRRTGEDKQIGVEMACLLCSDRYTAEDEMQYPNSLLVAPLPPLRARHSSSFTAMIFSPLAYLCPSVSDLFLTPVHHDGQEFLDCEEPE